MIGTGLPFLQHHFHGRETVRPGLLLVQYPQHRLASAHFLLQASLMMLADVEMKINLKLTDRAVDAKLYLKFIIGATALGLVLSPMQGIFADSNGCKFM